MAIMTNSWTPYLFNPGLLSTKLPPDLFDEVKKKCALAKKNGIPYNDKLLALIKEEYEFPRFDDFDEYIMSMYDKWCDTFMVVKNETYIDQIWVNFMKRGEYNPNHFHPGASAVFVLWVDIPYDIEEELKHFEYYSNTIDQPKVASLELTYTTLTGRIMSSPIKVDKSFEGVMLMFPSDMTHCVYPFFTSDKSRISLAGNIRFKNK